MKSPSTSSAFLSLSRKPSSPMSWSTSGYLCPLLTPPLSELTLSSPNSSLSSETMLSSGKCLPSSSFFSFPLISVRPLTLPCLVPAPPSLSCWWTGDSTTFWTSSPGLNSLHYSALLYWHSQRSNDRYITETRWRQMLWKCVKEIHLLMGSTTPCPPH